jgi:general stress protein 26
MMDDENRNCDESGNDISEVGRLIEGIRIAMLTTLSGEGRLVSRPLSTRDVTFDGVLWFLTSISSKKAYELAADAHVNLAYVDEDGGRYVSIDGRGAIVHDPEKIAQLWNETFDRMYFPKGPGDPDLVLLRVTAETAEAWTSASSKMGRAFDFIKARVTHTPSTLDSSTRNEQRHYERH